MAGSFLKAAAVALLALNAVGVTATGGGGGGPKRPGHGRPVPGRNDCEEHDVEECEYLPGSNVIVNGGFDTGVLAPWVAISPNKDSGVVPRERFGCKETDFCYFATTQGDYREGESLYIEIDTVKGSTYDLTAYSKGINNQCKIKYIIGNSAKTGKTIASITNKHSPLQFSKASGSHKATSSKTKLWIDISCNLKCDGNRGVIIDEISFVPKEKVKVCSTTVSTSYFPTKTPTTIETPPPVTTTPEPTIETTTDVSPTTSDEEPEPSCTPGPSAPICEEEAAAVPECAVTCIAPVAAEFGCAADDYRCLCSNIDAIQGQVIGCVLGGCGAQVGDVLPAVQGLCGCVAAAPPAEDNEECPPATTDIETPPPVTTTPEPTIETTTDVSPTTSDEEPEPTPTGDCQEWVYQDCIPDHNENRALPHLATPDVEGEMTNEGCQAECARLGFIYAGTEYGQECFCGNAINMRARTVTPGDCVMPCKGDASQICGGDWSLSVWKLTDAICETSTQTVPETTTTDIEPEPTTTDVEPEPTTTDIEPEPTTTDVEPEPTCTPIPSAPICEEEAAAVPECAVTCIAPVAAEFNCAADDYRCLCANIEAIQGQVIGCVLGGCGAQVADVLPAVQGLCGCVAAAPPAEDNEECPPTTTDVEPEPSTTPEPTTIPEPTIETTTDVSPTTSDEEPEPTCTPAPSAPICEEEAAAVPECAVTCIAPVAAEFNCAADDYRCLCANIEAIQGQVIGCVLGGCGSQVADVLPAVQGLCGCVAAAPPAEDNEECPPATTTDIEPEPTTTDIEPEPTTTDIEPGPTTTDVEPEPTCTPIPAEPICEEEAAAVPECAVTCIAPVAAEFNCAADDYRCLCANIEAIQGQVIGCVIGGCGGQVADVLPAVQGLCGCVAAAPPAEDNEECPPTDGEPSTSLTTIETTTDVSPTTEGTITVPTTYPSGSTTSTVSETITYTVTSCGPEVTKCPGTPGQVITTVIEHVTICPIEPTDDGEYPTPKPTGTPKPTKPVTPGPDDECTPGVDCPEEDDECTPGVDCPEEDDDCTPGVDCPEETGPTTIIRSTTTSYILTTVAPEPTKPATCTPGVDCPEDDEEEVPVCEEGEDCEVEVTTHYVVPVTTLPPNKPVTLSTEKVKPVPTEPASCTPGVDCPEDDVPAPTGTLPSKPDAPIFTGAAVKMGASLGAVVAAFAGLML